MKLEPFERTMKSMDGCELKIQSSIDVVNGHLNGHEKPIARRVTDWLRRKITQEK